MIIVKYSVKNLPKLAQQHRRRDAYWTSFKALYRTEKITMSNMLTADFDHTPNHVTEGKVVYTPEDTESYNYKSQSSNRINSIIYSGYWHFILPHGNYITFNPHYAYTHTNQHYAYNETGAGAILNGVIDDSHQASGNVSFVHSFEKGGSFKAMCKGYFLQNRTRYSGSSTTSDIARIYRLGPGLNYTYSNEKFYGNIGIGIDWDCSEYGKIAESSYAPWVKIALQYAFNQKNSLYVNFSYGKSIPQSSFRSAAIIKSNPLMSYTGNPLLAPYNTYQIEGQYTLIPNNRFSLSAFGFAWIVDNRYVYDYEATADGILRTIKQPMGDYVQWQYGLQGSIRLFDNNLQFGISCYMDQTYNGEPYNWTKSKLTASLSAYYYLNKIYFGASYNAPSGYADGCMVGTWITPRDSYTFQIGWSNNNWNLRFFTRNFLRYNTFQTKSIMNSEYYDSVRYIYSGSFSGFFQISATYTFGFGKKVKAENEAYQASGASSGILK